MYEGDIVRPNVTPTLVSSDYSFSKDQNSSQVRVFVGSTLTKG